MCRKCIYRYIKPTSLQILAVHAEYLESLSAALLAAISPETILSPRLEIVRIGWNMKDRYTDFNFVDELSVVRPALQFFAGAKRIRPHMRASSDMYNDPRIAPSLPAICKRRYHFRKTMPISFERSLIVHGNMAGVTRTVPLQSETTYVCGLYRN